MSKIFQQLLFILPTLCAFSPDVMAQTSGQQLYMQNCMVCHADDGSGGMPGVADLTENRNWSTISEEKLLERIKQGIALPGAAVTMPPNGGNPDLSDSDLKLIIKYMRMEFTKK